MSEVSPDSQTLRDIMDPARAAALCVSLGYGGQPMQAGAPLPPFFHHAYFWQTCPENMLGADGHLAPGRGLIPDTGLPRRMWAGGRLEFLAPLVLGKAAVRESRVVEVTHKQGRSGRLAFVTLAHEIHQGGRLVLREWQDLVYRAEGALRSDPPRAPDNPEGAEPVAFSTTLLFRYSALTMNAHRIHYDLDYARRVEGYPGLVVHGPLIAQFLMLKARRELGPLAGFQFRATAPLIQGEGAMLCRDGHRLWLSGPDGRLCMEAEATV